MDFTTIHWLFQCMGYSQVAATAVVDKQGINSHDKLHILKDEEITNLSKVIRCPDGQIANSNLLQ
jgi:ribosomal protein S13